MRLLSLPKIISRRIGDSQPLCWHSTYSHHSRLGRDAIISLSWWYNKSVRPVVPTKPPLSPDQLVKAGFDLTAFLMCGTAPLSRHHCAKVWSLRQPHEREPFHAADYHHRSGFGQASISSPWR